MYMRCNAMVCSCPRPQCYEGKKQSWEALANLADELMCLGCLQHVDHMFKRASDVNYMLKTAKTRQFGQQALPSSAFLPS